MPYIYFIIILQAGRSGVIYVQFDENVNNVTHILSFNIEIQLCNHRCSKKFPRVAHSILDA